MSTFGTIWIEPNFEEMADKAGLIAVVEVTTGGDFSCRAKVVEVVKGNLPPDTEIAITGYNNRHWPERAIQAEAIATGDKLLVFLYPIGVPEDSRPPHLPLQRQWAIPSPSTGDFRIRDGKVHGGWLAVSHPHTMPGVDSDVVIELVRGYVLSRNGQTPNKARITISKLLTPESVREIESDTERDERKAWSFQWLLCAQAAYGERRHGEAIFAAAHSPNQVVKTCAARALRSLGGGREVLDLLGELLLYTNSAVQSEACRTLIAGSFKREAVVPLLLKALSKADPRGEGSRNLMDSILTRQSYGRAMIVHALTRFGAAADAEDALVELIPSVFVRPKNDDSFGEPREFLDAGLLNTLAAHFLKHPSSRAREAFFRSYGKVDELEAEAFHQYFFQEGSRESLEAIMRRIRLASKPAFGTHSLLERLALHLRAGDTGLESLIFELLRKYEGQEVARDIMPAAIAAASPRIQELLQNYRTQSLRKGDSRVYEIGWEQNWLEVFEATKKGVDLKLDAETTPTRRLEGWMNLLREDYGKGFLTGFVLIEVIRTTPTALRLEAASKIRELGLRYSPGQIFWAIQKLGDTLSVEEEKELEVFKRTSFSD